MNANQVIAANLIRLRTEHGWTRKHLARELGWSYQVAGLAERAATGYPDPGRRLCRQFSIDDLFLIAGIFRVPVTELLAAPGQCSRCLGDPPRSCPVCGADGLSPEAMAGGAP